MDTLFQVLLALACAAVTAAVPVLLPRLLTMISANIHQKDVALIADAAARAAGRIAVAVAGQAPGGGLKAAVAASLAAEVVTLKAQLPDTIAKVGASDSTLAQMVQGEVGKLIAGAAGQAVEVVAALPSNVVGIKP